MSTNYKTLEKGIKQLLITFSLLIFSPILLNISFKALKKYTESPEIFIAYGLLALSILSVLFTVFLLFKTFKTFLDALFNK